MSRNRNFLFISSSIIILGIGGTNTLFSFFAKLKNTPFRYWHRTMIVCSLNLRTTVASRYYQIQEFKQNVSMNSTQITRSYGNNRRRGSRDTIDSGEESDDEDSDDEVSNRKRLSRRKKKRVKSRIPDYDEFARFRDSSRPPDSHYTSVGSSTSSSDKPSTAPEKPPAPSEGPPAPNQEPAPPEEDPNTKK